MLIVIPAYQPNEKLISVVKSLKHHHILVIDDGSGSDYDEVFEAAEECGAEIIRYTENRGKGNALKTAFKYILNANISTDWIVTADADGQHKVADIEKVIEIAESSEHDMIIGCRRFTGYVPLRSRVGNWFAGMTFKILVGIKISDTQSGLRAYRGSEMNNLLLISGDRYEYEMNCLMAYRNRIDEVTIETVYEVGNKSSHYRPVIDSVRVMKAMLRMKS